MSKLERAQGDCGNCEIAEEFSRGVFEEKSKEECTSCQDRQQRIQQHVKLLIIDGQEKVNQVEENGEWLREQLNF